MAEEFIRKRDARNKAETAVIDCAALCHSFVTISWFAVRLGLPQPTGSGPAVGPSSQTIRKYSR